MRNPRSLTLGLALLSLAWSAPALAGPTPAARCEAAELKAAAKGCACRHDVAAKALLSGATPDFLACGGKLAAAFTKAEGKGGCAGTGEEPTVDGRLAQLVSDVSAALQSATASGRAAVACAAAKLEAAGKKCACVHKTAAAAALKRIPADFSACDAKLTSAYMKAETKAAGACPTVGDAESICDDVQASFAEVEADVANLGTADFATSGPYGAGVQTVTLVDTSRPTAPNGSYPGAPTRTLVTDIWYPAIPNGIAQQTNGPIAAGSFPLLVRAHGFSGFRNDSVYILQHLASNGYVVVAPDFPLSNLNAPGGPTLADVGEQARDLSFLIDTVTADDSDVSSFLFGHVDTTKIGAIGHSLGGATVLLATYHSTLRDPRILATVALAPLGCVFLDGFFDSATVPLIIEGGTADMITPYQSNHLQPYGFVQAPKYLLTLDGGTHLGFADRLGFGKTEDGDAAIGCSLFVHPGDPRPVTINPGLPPDFLGGPAAGVDPSGSMCQPICPLPPATFMLQARQNTLAKAASLAFFESKLRGSVSGHRMITGRLETDNPDAALMFEE